jgi:hypothetical protein
MPVFLDVGTIYTVALKASHETSARASEASISLVVALTPSEMRLAEKSLIVLILRTPIDWHNCRIKNPLAFDGFYYPYYALFDHAIFLNLFL